MLLELRDFTKLHRIVLIGCLSDSGTISTVSCIVFVSPTHQPQARPMLRNAYHGPGAKQRQLQVLVIHCGVAVYELLCALRIAQRRRYSLLEAVADHENRASPASSPVDTTSRLPKFIRAAV